MRSCITIGISYLPPGCRSDSARDPCRSSRGSGSSRQTRVHVQPGDREGVVVVPERRRRLLVRILDRLSLTPPVLLPEFVA